MVVIPDLFLNAGGVTVSYFEWLRNLSHVRFGRMSRRFEQSTNERLLHAIEAATGKALAADIIAELATGASEEDLVNSGLQDTMIEAYGELRNVKQQQGVDLRTAAFINAINKVAVSYMEMGIFP